MEMIRRDEVLQNAGQQRRKVRAIASLPKTRRSTRVTVTRVTVPLGATQPRHAHANSEQIWVALRGNARLLLEGSAVETFGEGDVVRFSAGDVHGLENSGAESFVYLAVTSPPINFRPAYAAEVTGSR